VNPSKPHSSSPADAWRMLRDRLSETLQRLSRLEQRAAELVDDRRLKVDVPRFLELLDDWGRVVRDVERFDRAARMLLKRAPPVGELEALGHEVAELYGLTSAVWNRLRSRFRAADWGERLGDPSGHAIVESLRSFGISDPTAEAVTAFYKVLTRTPRHGPEPRWQVKEQSGTPEQFYRWVRAAVRGASRDAKDFRRRWGRTRKIKPLNAGGELPTQPVALHTRAESDEAMEILHLLAADARLSPRELEILSAIRSEERGVDTAKRLGIKPGTVYALKHRLKRKIKKARRLTAVR